MPEDPRDIAHRDLARVVDDMAGAILMAWEIGADHQADLPGLLSQALQQVARDLGGAGVLVEGRPGSWEAVHVLALAGLPDDEWGV
jgi:hypothetical protein